MKKGILFTLLVLFALSSCSKDDDKDQDSQDVSELIIGTWSAGDGSCNGGYTFWADGTWSFGTFQGCPETCGIMPFGGTYTVTGNEIQSTGGPGQLDNLRGRVEIKNDTFTLYDSDSNELLASYVKTTGCQN